MAFPVYDSSGTVVAETDDSIAVPYPGTVAAGDLLILQVFSRDDVGITMPGDFTVDGTNGTRNQNASTTGSWGWRIATGSESGTVTVTTGAASGGLLLGVIHRFTGAAATGTPYDVTAQVGLGSNATLTPGDVDPPDAQDRLIVVLAYGNNDGITLGNYTGGTATVTERFEHQSSVGADGYIHVADAQHNGSGNFDPGSQNAVTAHAQIQFTIAVLPAAGVVDADAEVSFAEVETPFADADAEVSWAEVEVPTADSDAEVSWAEVEVPFANADTEISFGEVEVPDVGVADADAEISWAEFEVPFIDAQAEISWAEVEIPFANAQAEISFGEFEVPFVNADAEISWAEVQVPDFGTPSDRQQDHLPHVGRR